jgi:hypothetical protein
MAVSGTILALLIRTKMDTKFKQVQNYAGPLAQNNPSYFISMCDAIGNGIIQGNPVINFVTVDTGLSGSPPKVGTGLGLGVIVDKDWFTKELYKEIRAQSVATYGSSSNPAWCDPYNAFNDPQNPLPPEHCSLHNNQYNPYNFLTAMCEAISESVTEHYAQFRILNSTHPTIYSGTGNIEAGGFVGVVPTTVASSIQGLGANLLGSFWPILCQAIGKVYAQAIMQQSTGSVVIIGVCAPSQSQVCGLPLVGVGTGTAS